MEYRRGGSSSFCGNGHMAKIGLWSERLVSGTSVYAAPRASNAVMPPTRMKSICERGVSPVREFTPPFHVQGAVTGRSGGGSEPPTPVPVENMGGCTVSSAKVLVATSSRDVTNRIKCCCRCGMRDELAPNHGPTKGWYSQRPALKSPPTT